MTTIRTQIHLTAPAREALELAPEEAGERAQSLSDRANLILVRYATGTASHCPTLTDAEWCAVCDACNGLWMDSSNDSAAFIHCEVADCRGLGAKWGVDQGALVQRLQGMTTLEKWAVADVVARFWARAPLHEENLVALRAAGAKVAG